VFLWLLLALLAALFPLAVFAQVEPVVPVVETAPLDWQGIGLEVWAVFSSIVTILSILATRTPNSSLSPIVAFLGRVVNLGALAVGKARPDPNA
jgi:hypothetical protein